MICQYNQYMGGVDAKDKNIYHLTCSRQTTKYWKQIVYNFIDMALFDAYHLYKLCSSKPESKLTFINEIILGLANNSPVLDVPAVIPHIPFGEAFEGHGIQSLSDNGSLRRCGVCKKRSVFWCPGCNIGVHKKCLPLLQHYPRGRQRGQKTLPGAQH
ncbi:hypothetical protein J6590_108792 [Homalodisca vitripennis]|nr:hypothetical protein J6590_108792 [Homalodisca vitripennis]